MHNFFALTGSRPPARILRMPLPFPMRDLPADNQRRQFTVTINQQMRPDRLFIPVDHADHVIVHGILFHGGKTNILGGDQAMSGAWFKADAPKHLNIDFPTLSAGETVIVSVENIGREVIKNFQPLMMVLVLV